MKKGSVVASLDATLLLRKRFIIGVESPEGPGLPNRADHLPDQARLAGRLSHPTTQESLRSDGSCVSPRFIRQPSNREAITIRMGDNSGYTYRRGREQRESH